MNHAFANRIAKLERQAQPSAPPPRISILATSEEDAERQLAEMRAAGRDMGDQEPFVVILVPLTRKPGP